MSLTPSETYGVIHAAIVRGAREFEVTPHVAKTVLAISDLGGEGVVSDSLEAALGDDPSMVRRSVLAISSASLALVKAADGGHRRQGVRNCLTLSTRGHELANRVRAHIGDFTAARVVASAKGALA